MAHARRRVRSPAAALALLASVVVAPATSPHANLAAQETPAADVTGPLGLSGRLDPAEYLARRDSLLTTFDARDFSSAYRLARELTAAWDRDSGAWGRLGVAAERTGHPDEALAAYARAFELGTAYQPFLAHRAAAVAVRLGDHEAALAWIRRALDARFENRSDLQTMDDFRDLRSDPEFRRLAGFAPDTTADRTARWRYDLEYLGEEARRLHASPGRQAFSPAFTDGLAALRDSVPALSDGAILRGLQRVVALLGDGHSVVYGIVPAGGGPPPALPLVLYQFDDGIFVVDADSARTALIGSRVLAFGDVPADTVLWRLAPYVNHDNAMTIRWLGVRFYMRSTGWLHTVGAAPDTSRAELTLRGPDGTVRRVTLRPAPDRLPRKLRWPWRHEAGGGAGRHGSPPLWLQDAASHYWSRWLPDAGVLYVQFNQVRDEKGHPLKAFAAELRARIDSTGTHTVVVDVRRNNGGNNGLLEPLLRTLEWFDVDRPGNRLFVITSRNTFSAAQDFVNRVDRRTDAIFVGEPSASKPNFTGEDTEVVLPYSRARVSISSRYWEDSDPGDDRPWVAPDMPVGLTSADYFAGRDPALEAVFEAVKADRMRDGR